MKVHDQRWGSIGLCLCCSVNWGGRQCMHPGGARISIRGTLLSFTIWDCQWLHFISTARGKAGQAEEEDNSLL